MIAWTAVLAAVSIASCKPNVGCEALHQRNSECADAIVEEMKNQMRASMAARLGGVTEQNEMGMPHPESSTVLDDRVGGPSDARRPDRLALMERRFAEASRDAVEILRSDVFLRECRASWNDPAVMPPHHKKDLAQCLALDGCSRYASCLMRVVSSERVPDP